MPPRWIIAQIDPSAAEALATAAGVHPLTARVLLGRGVRTPDEARAFLDPALADVPNPFGLPGMETAVERLAQAVERGERIAIFGDYDVDGITGTALLANVLAALGLSPRTLLPSRHGSGYGLSPEAVEECARSRMQLIVTVDNGSHAHEACREAHERHLDIIVTDHHEMALRPDAAAVVNPKMEGTPGALAELSGCGVAFMLALALRRRLREKGILPAPEPNLRSQLDLVALGTIADAVSLTGVNRCLARHGLTEIARTGKIGIRALLDVSGTDPARLSAGAVAFQLAPRINAAGRLADPRRALELLQSTQADEAWGIARELDAANRERQRIEERILAEAQAQCGKQLPDRAGIVVASKGWHVGVIGIVAAKIAQRHHRPAIVISLDTAPARGSARGFTGVHIAQALAGADDLLVRHGGHAMAGGLSIHERDIEAFAERFDDFCREGLPSEREALLADARAEPQEISGALAEEFARLAPFGAGNPPPTLLLERLEVVDRRIVGNGHLKLRLRANGIHFEAFGYNMESAILPPNAPIDILCTPELNSFRGVTTVQLKLSAIRPS